MGEEKGPEYYTGKSSIRNSDKYKPLYVKVIDMLNETGVYSRIIEMGSGLGTLAGMLYANEYRNYMGFDFSPDMISYAKENHGNQIFMQYDLKDPSIQKFYFGCSWFICLEVLEHIKDDFLVLSYLPKGANLIFSLPISDAKAHVRWFKKQEEIYDRYSSVLRIEECQFVRKWFLCRGVKI